VGDSPLAALWVSTACNKDIFIFLPGSVMWVSGWIIAITHDVAATSISQYIINLLLAILTISISIDAEICSL
jgi:hypothetical protein